MSQTASVSPVVAGRTITWARSGTNTGPGKTPGVVVTAHLPAAVSYVGAIPASTACTQSGGTPRVVTCNLPGTLAVDQVRTFSIVALVDSATQATTITNTASVSSVLEDLDMSNNETPGVATSVTRLSDLVVTKTVNNTTPDGHQEITYTVKVRNAGPSRAYGVVVEDFVPDGMQFSGIETTQG